jgi:ketosteroid isomerase-like protein
VERQQALATRNIDRYTAIISRTYHDKGLDFAAKRAELAQTLTSWEQIDFLAEAHRITLHGDTATATAAYRLRVTKQGKTFELAGEEVLRLQQEQGGWKIVGGL